MLDVRRREFITLLGGAAAAWPLAARAQQSKVARIGALYIGIADSESFKTNLREGLRELGYIVSGLLAPRLQRLDFLAGAGVRLLYELGRFADPPPQVLAAPGSAAHGVLTLAGLGHLLVEPG